MIPSVIAFNIIMKITKKFKSFITEEDNEKPYKLIVFQNSGDEIRDVKDTALGQITELLKKAASEL